MPMDPMSWVVLYNAHHDALADLIASNMRHRLPAESLRQTPSASVRPQNCAVVFFGRHARRYVGCEWRLCCWHPMSRAQVG